MKQTLTNKQKEYIIFKDKLRLTQDSPNTILIKNAVRFFCLPRFLHRLSLKDSICSYYFKFVFVSEKIIFVDEDMICYKAQWFSWIMHSLILDECYAHSSKFKQ